MDTAESFIAQRITGDFPSHNIRISDLDPRLTLTACDAPLEGFLPPGGHLPGNTTVGVRCPGAKPWTIYLPATVTVRHKMVVTKRPVSRGASITLDDIALEEREVTGLAGDYIADPEQVLGKIAKRPLTASAALAPDMLAAPLLVRRGQQVTILAVAEGFEVRMAGTALMDGSEGQVVRAQAAISKRMVEGRVIEPGIIRVDL